MPHSVLSIVSSFEKATGVKIPFVFGPRRQGDIEKVWANIDKAHEILNWKPQFSLADAMLHAWKWEQTLDKM